MEIELSSGDLQRIPAQALGLTQAMQMRSPPNMRTDVSFPDRTEQPAPAHRLTPGERLTIAVIQRKKGKDEVFVTFNVVANNGDQLSDRLNDRDVRLLTSIAPRAAQAIKLDQRRGPSRRRLSYTRQQ